VELGALHGASAGLATHFHDEAQITIVLAGRRSFLIGGEVVDVPAGWCACIHAQTPHRALSVLPGTACLNAYILTATKPATTLAWKVMRWQHHDCGVSEAAGLAARIGTDWPAMYLEQANAMPPIQLRDHEPVRRLAARLGMSREGYSRMFTKRNGIAPHAFGLVQKLNHARHMLRAGEAIAAAAAEAGFADQSHLGRCFRRTFGTTPGRYRPH
jgi:AraC-like DNA-binding protein